MPFLLLQPLLLVHEHLAQRLPADGQAAQHAEGRQRDEDDPYRLQAFGVDARRDLLRPRRQLGDDACARARASAAQRGGHVRAEGRAEGVLALGHAVLEDDAADDDGDGGGHVAREAEGRGRGGDVARLDKALQRNEWGLEIRAYTQTGDDLVDDDAGPGAAVVG